MIKWFVLVVVGWLPVGAVFAGFLGDAINNSELQYEVGDEAVWQVLSSDTLKKDPQTLYYYLYPGYQVFEVARNGKQKVRAELRQFPEWSVADWRQMDARLRLPATDLDEVTWMQLHRKSSGSVTPPLRLTLEGRRELDGVMYEDYLFAVIHHKNSGYKRVPLGPRPDGDFQATLRANNHQIMIALNNTLVHVENVSDWADYDCYFKVGLYASGNDADYGEAKMGIKSLSYEAK